MTTSTAPTAPTDSLGGLAMPTLARLCGDVERFSADHWDVAARHHPGGRFDDLFSLDEADRLLGAGALQVPNHLRLSRIEPTISDWEKHCRWVETELGQLTPIIDVDSALREYAGGRTIIFHALRERVPALDEFCLAIEQEIGHGASADAFLTPPHAQCWDPHYDVGDIFVVQIHGSKRWRLWPILDEVPLSTHCPNQTNAQGEITEVDLVEGDVLYVPRGMPHAARTGDEASLHVTISINPTTWRDAVRRLLGPLHHEPELRRSMPVGFTSDPELIVEGTRATLDLVHELLTRRSTAEAAKWLAEGFTTRPATSVGALKAAVLQAEGASDEG